MQQENKPVLLDWMVLFALMLIWGSSFILIKRGLESFSSLQLGALRVSISFLVLLPLAIQRIRKISKKNVHLFIIAGLLGNGIPAFLFAKAQTGLDSYMAGILNSLTPLFTLIAGVLFFGRSTRPVNVLGVILGLIGAAGLLSVAGNGSFILNIGPALLIVLATICYAFQMNFIKNYMSGFDPVTIASVAFVFIGIPSLIFLLAGTDFLALMKNDSHNWAGLGYVTILAVLGTSLAIIVNFWLIKRTSALFSSSVTYLMPIVSTMWGIIDGESFLPGFAIWMVIILAGVYMANRATKKKTG
ncbi:MAG: DMT family transporter [Sphingobacteriia bacterium]|nr:DMT family transporter [Sphingobacteriia bacterium]